MAPLWIFNGRITLLLLSYIPLHRTPLPWTLPPLWRLWAGRQFAAEFFPQRCADDHAAGRCCPVFRKSACGVFRFEFVELYQVGPYQRSVCRWTCSIVGQRANGYKTSAIPAMRSTTARKMMGLPDYNAWEIVKRTNACLMEDPYWLRFSEDETFEDTTRGRARKIMKENQKSSWCYSSLHF